MSIMEHYFWIWRKVLLSRFQDFLVYVFYVCMSIHMSTKKALNHVNHKHTHVRTHIHTSLICDLILKFTGDRPSLIKIIKKYFPSPLLVCSRQLAKSKPWEWIMSSEKNRWGGFKAQTHTHGPRGNLFANRNLCQQEIPLQLRL